MFTDPPKAADPAPGSRPAPELDRFDAITAERDGQPAPATAGTRSAAALGVLAAVIGRDGQEHSATWTRLRNLADADHLALLNAIWTAETAPTRQQRYRGLLTAVLPAGYQDQASHKAKWLWRPCAPPNWPVSTRPECSASPPPNGTWPAHATSPP